MEFAAAVAESAVVVVAAVAVAEPSDQEFVAYEV